MSTPDNPRRARVAHVTQLQQAIPRHPDRLYSRTTLAGGLVAWRLAPASGQSDSTEPHRAPIEVAVVHRPIYDDWSLPKGKLDSGENLLTTALRECYEETGYEVRLGKLLGHVAYPVGNRAKVNYYWAAQLIGGEFVANEEVDLLRWLPVDEAVSLVSYDLDREVLHAAERWLSQPIDSVVYLVRHARAYARHNWHGDDNARPIDPRGRRQAEALAPILAAWDPHTVHSARPVRCQETLAPFEEDTGAEVDVSVWWGDEKIPDEQPRCVDALRSLMNTPGRHVVSSQGLWIPRVLETVATQDGVDLRGVTGGDAVDVRKGSVCVLHCRGGKLVAVDYYESMLAVK